MGRRRRSRHSRVGRGEREHRAEGVADDEARPGHLGRASSAATASSRSPIPLSSAALKSKRIVVNPAAGKARKNASTTGLTRLPPSSDGGADNDIAAGPEASARSASSTWPSDVCNDNDLMDGRSSRTNSLGACRTPWPPPGTSVRVSGIDVDGAGGVASLPMYDFAELVDDHDLLWRLSVPALDGVRDGRAGPLTRGADTHAPWHDPRLWFSQTCGWPLVHELAGQVRVVGRRSSTRSSRPQGPAIAANW